MLEAEVSRQILIDLEQHPDNSPQLVLNLPPELYETTRLGQEAQSSKSEEKVWWEEEANSRNTSWSAHRSTQSKSAGQDDDSGSEENPTTTLMKILVHCRKNMSFSSPPTTRSKAKQRGSAIVPSRSPY
eukprot:scaffold120197_cov49-Attheya_sp.AAC.3